VDNAASRRGIEKAGFVRSGEIRRVFCPLAPGWMHATWRGFRRRAPSSLDRATVA
jgi:RimJ/RimL family protein N-acetyltransferase